MCYADYYECSGGCGTMIGEACGEWCAMRDLHVWLVEVTRQCIIEDDGTDMIEVKTKLSRKTTPVGMGVLVDNGVGTDTIVVNRIRMCNMCKNRNRDTIVGKKMKINA